MLHSLGGGTGSGVGTFILTILEDAFPEVFRFTGSVFPATQHDDVVTSPYNSMLALSKLLAHADCVLPIDNQALMGIIDRIQKTRDKEEAKSTVADTAGRAKAYDRMNSLVAHLLANLTCSMRFEGVLNVDFNEITMNLVPYPDLKFLVPALAPLYSLLDSKVQPRRFDQMFDDVLDPHYQFLESSPLAHRYLSLGFILRGAVTFSDVNHNIRRIREHRKLSMIHWNTEGFKYGICNSPPIGQPYSVLALANNTCIRLRFAAMLDKFDMLFKRKVYLQHYSQYMEVDEFS
jgi:tubulin epsilon